MPRPKGSKNKSALTLDEQIIAAEARVEAAKAELKVAEADLKTLTALRDEEQVKTLMNAIAASGKSVADVVAMINNSNESEPAAE